MCCVQLRNYLVNKTNWAQSRTQVLQVTSQGITIMKGNVVTILTNIGSPVRFDSKELDLFRPIGLAYTAAKCEHIRLYALA